MSGASGNLRDVLLVRHGSTHLNHADTSVDRIRGHIDVPLNEEGKKQAHAVADKIAQSPPHALVSSDLCRAKLTTQIIANRTGVPVAEVSDRFRPWDVGQLSGQLSKKAIPILAKYAENNQDKPLPKGESFNTFRGRFFLGLHDALQKNPGTLAVVSHHRNERLLHAWKAAGFPPTGDIHIRTFNTKGETTGAATPMQIPMDRLAAAAQHLQSHVAEPADFDQARQKERPGE